MQNGKVDNQLLLAVELPEEEREETQELNVGYDEAENSWELIVKAQRDFLQSNSTQGNLAEGETPPCEEAYCELPEAVAQLGIEVVARLRNGYTILNVPENRIEALSQLPEIEYIEKPKKLYFDVENGIAASCILPVQRRDSFPQGRLTGSGVIVAVIDSGIDYAHADFRNADGTTRLIGLWDMTLSRDEANPPPDGYGVGRFYSKGEINRALEFSVAERQQAVPSRDVSGHGTAVAGIACGNGRASALRERGGLLRDREEDAHIAMGRNRGVAYESDILAVKLGGTDAEARTTRLMMAVDFCISVALERLQPIVINLSYGNNYGAHNGASLVERYLQSVADVWKSNIVIGSGNEGAAAHHASGRLSDTDRTERIVEWVVGSGERGFGLQLWLSYLDEIAVSLIAPSGREYGPLQQTGTAQMSVMDGTKVYLYVGEPKPYDTTREYYFEFIPEGETVTEGIWRLRIRPLAIRDGRYDLWLPAAPAVGNAVRFLRPDPDTTLTIPSTVENGITVGAYDVAADGVAVFSGRGYLPGGGTVKPDLVAPGVNILTTAPGGGYSRKTGTSFAAPFVSGSAALLMQWGIVWGNDPYLYGEKLKAYLLRGARVLPGQAQPSPLSGWGALCVVDSIPET